MTAKNKDFQIDSGELTSCVSNNLMFSASPPGSLTVSSLIPLRFEGQLAVKAVVAACRGAGTTLGGTEDSYFGKESEKIGDICTTGWPFVGNEGMKSYHNQCIASFPHVLRVTEIACNILLV